MAAEPTVAMLNVHGGAWRRRVDRLYAVMSDYWALTKPEVNLLILITTFAGFYLAPAAGAGRFRIMLIMYTLQAHCS
jgi:heme O synthase-like polyprenyltransferase